MKIEHERYYHMIIILILIYKFNKLFFLIFYLLYYYLCIVVVAYKAQPIFSFWNVGYTCFSQDFPFIRLGHKKKVTGNSTKMNHATATATMVLAMLVFTAANHVQDLTGQQIAQQLGGEPNEVDCLRDADKIASRRSRSVLCQTQTV